MAAVQYMAGFMVRGNIVRKERWGKQDVRLGEGRDVLVAHGN